MRSLAFDCGFPYGVVFRILPFFEMIAVLIFLSPFQEICKIFFDILTLEAETSIFPIQAGRLHSLFTSSCHFSEATSVEPSAMKKAFVQAGSNPSIIGGEDGILRRMTPSFGVNSVASPPQYSSIWISLNPVSF